jgi:hypothetical protein
MSRTAWLCIIIPFTKTSELDGSEQRNVLRFQLGACIKNRTLALQSILYGKIVSIPACNRGTARIKGDLLIRFGYRRLFTWTNGKRYQARVVFHQKKGCKNTSSVPRIPTWSPTAVLTRRYVVYVWQSGRDAQLSTFYDRTRQRYPTLHLKLTDIFGEMSQKVLVEHLSCDHHFTLMVSTTGNF